MFSYTSNTKTASHLDNLTINFGIKMLKCMKQIYFYIIPKKFP